jgi:thymidylate synthase ThyX
MQARTQLFGISGWLAKRVWFGARWFAVLAAWILNKLGLHKQIANRIVEPWAHITTLVTATEFEGWFRLRCHEDAQPEIRNLALKMQKLYDNRDATLVDTFEYHLPFINLIDRLTHSNDTNILRKISVARCARVSYLNHNNKVANAEEDIKLHDQLLASGHMSPFEHQALAMTNKNWSGPFQGWFQYRETVDKNFVKVGE